MMRASRCDGMIHRAALYFANVTLRLQHSGPGTSRLLADVKAADLRGVKVNDRVPGVRLADAVELVRSELQEARERGASSSLAFVPGPVELEFEVVFDATAGVDAGIRVWVVSLGAKAEVSRGQTQRLKVTLSPVDRGTGKAPQISDEGSR